MPILLADLAAARYSVNATFLQSLKMLADACNPEKLIEPAIINHMIFCTGAS
jgi:hypothetical protein